MKIKLISILVIFLSIAVEAYSQKVSGYVYEILENSKSPLIGANVYQANTTNGTVTDQEGFFRMEMNNTEQQFLVFSFVGYQNDTISVTEVNNT